MSTNDTHAHIHLSTRARRFPRLNGLDPSDLTSIGPGAFVRTDEWATLFSEGRLCTRAHAVARRTRATNRAYSHMTAAALHGLPVYRVRSDRVDMVVPNKRPRRNSSDVVRHHCPLPDKDVVVIDGLRVTSLERTVYDVIRGSSLEAALVCFDAALHQVAWDDTSKTYDELRAETFRAGVVARIRSHTGARGIRQARLVAELADGRAQSPGETISRLWMWQLGMPTPELQYRVEFGDGTYALLDFAWPHLGRWGEFDGDVKYTDPMLMAGRTLDEVIADQSAREWKVRRATGWTADRWGFDKLDTLSGFAGYLREIGFSRVA